MPHIQTISVQSPVTGEAVQANLYLPPGYRPGEPLPVIHCHFARVWFGLTALPYWLDDQLADGEGQFPRCMAVGLPDPERWDGGAEEASEAYGHLVRSIVAEVGRLYTPSSRLILAGSDGAVMMLNVLLDHPGLFGRAALASPGWLVRDGDRLETKLDGPLRRIERTPAGSLPAFWFCWGDTESEESIPDRWEKYSRPNGRTVMQALQAKGASVEHRFYPGGHTVTLWNRSLPHAISFLLGIS